MKWKNTTNGEILGKPKKLKMVLKLFDSNLKLSGPGEDRQLPGLQHQDRPGQNQLRAHH
jgi:hypothetical protein